MGGTYCYYGGGECLHDFGGETDENMPLGIFQGVDGMLMLK